MGTLGKPVGGSCTFFIAEGSYGASDGAITGERMTGG
jgi:hypothetical protein